MSNDAGDFAVLAGKYKALAFRGSRKDVYDWITEHNGPDRVVYTIVDCVSREEEPEEYFIRDFELFHKEESKPEHKCLSEEDYRRIAREEFSKILDEAREKAGAPEHLDFERMGDFLLEFTSFIARVESKHLMSSIQKETQGNVGDSDGEYDAFKVVSRVSGVEAEYLPHKWDCGKRNVNNWPFNACTCGIEAAEEKPKIVMADVIGRGGKIVYSGTVSRVLEYVEAHLEKERLIVHVEGYQMSVADFFKHYKQKENGS